jgi:2',3'-cyclic-nucleotide 2'-phosphodiesterase (5'-nucleotidase family)
MKKLLGTLLLSAGLALSSSFTSLADDVDVTFLLVSDMYKMASAKAKRGGFARINALAKTERAKGGNLIYSHAGDFISPSLLSGFDKGEHVVELTNLVPPDFVIPGNHEFDFGKEVFLKRMGELKSTILSANLRRADGSKVPGIEDTKMLTFGDASDPMKSIKIGIVGLTLEDSPDLSSPGDLVFANSMDTAKASAKALKAAGADILVAILHEDISVDRKLYETGIFDFVLSGHDHDLTVNYNGRSVMAESRSEGDLVVALDVKFSISEKRGKRRVKWWPNFRIIDTDTVTPDAETLAKVKSYQDILSKELDVTIGKTAVELDSRKTSVRTGETAIGNLIADAQRAAVGADIAMANGGGIRGNKVYDAGSELTRRDILTELPFGNLNILIEIDGATIKAALENGVSQIEKTAGRFPQISGMSFTFDASKPAGERTSNIMIGDAPLDMAKKYKMATNDYAAGGGDGYKMLKKAKVLVGGLSAKLLANDVMAYIRKQGTVSPKIEGRIKGM